MSTIAGSFSGNLVFPPAAGQPNGNTPFNAAFDYSKKFNEEFDLTGSGTQAVSLANLGPDGAKFLAVWYKESSAATPAIIDIVINGGTDTEQLSKGGFKVHSNPTPDAAGGILSLSITYTQACRVEVWAFG